jgi:hypothetical protein
MPNTDALIFVQEAIDALSIEMWRGADPDNMERVYTPDSSISVELNRVDTAIGPRGESMFARLAENVDQAMIALFAARGALRRDHP